MDESLILIEKFLNKEDNTVPPDVPKQCQTAMYAMRHIRIEGKRERKALEGKITELTDIFLGKKPDRSNGLIEQIKANIRFRKTFTWLLTIITVAFLGGIGAWIWGLIVP